MKYFSKEMRRMMDNNNKNSNHNSFVKLHVIKDSQIDGAYIAWCIEHIFMWFTTFSAKRTHTRASIGTQRTGGTRPGLLACWLVMFWNVKQTKKATRRAQKVTESFFFGHGQASRQQHQTEYKREVRHRRWTDPIDDDKSQQTAFRKKSLGRPVRGPARYQFNWVINLFCFLLLFRELENIKSQHFIAANIKIKDIGQPECGQREPAARAIKTWQIGHPSSVPNGEKHENMKMRRCIYATFKIGGSSKQEATTAAWMSATIKSDRNNYTSLCFPCDVGASCVSCADSLRLSNSRNMNNNRKTKEKKKLGKVA